MLVFNLWRVSVLPLNITFSGLAKVAIFTTNVDAENQTLINHKCVCGALSRHFCQTRVIASGSCPPSLKTIVSIEFLCHCRAGCALRFLFFKALEKKNEILFWVGEVEALLQFLVCALACANCKCAYTCAMAIPFCLCIPLAYRVFLSCLKMLLCLNDFCTCLLNFLK